MRNFTTIALLVFVAATVVYLVIGDRGAAPNNPREAVTVDTSPPGGAPEVSGRIADADTAERIEQGEAINAAAPNAQKEVNPDMDTPIDHKVIAYYFHRTQRCHTCLTMETYAEQALKDAFSDALDAGKLEWRPVNVEEPENEHFVEDYELYASTLVMVETDSGQVKLSKKLEQIWDLAGDEQKFKTFVRDEARAYLEAASQ